MLNGKCRLWCFKIYRCIAFGSIFKWQIEICTDIFHHLTFFGQHLREVILKRIEYISYISLCLAVRDGQAKSAAFNRHSRKDAYVGVKTFIQKTFNHIVTYARQTQPYIENR